MEHNQHMGLSRAAQPEEEYAQVRPSFSRQQTALGNHGSMISMWPKKRDVMVFYAFYGV